MGATRMFKRLVKRLTSYSRASRARREFNKLVRAYDDAIEAARAGHRPTAVLIAAKRDFVHRCLGAGQ